MVSIVALICSYLMISDVENYSYSCWPFVCLLLRNVHSDLLPSFLIQLLPLSLWSSLYIVSINPFPTNTSQMYSLLQVVSELWCVFFVIKNLFVFMQFDLSIFAYVSCTFEILSKKFLPVLMFWSISSYFFLVVS
jgi:hypothetical protein